jgi:hypothetical protein
MDTWTPILALPNLDMRGAIECDYAAIVPLWDTRVEKLRSDHPRLMTFLSSFRGQFGSEIWPALLLLRSDAPRSYYTGEAVSAFRDILSLSVVAFARATRLRYDRADTLIFTNVFQFYPWMIDKNFEEMILINPAEKHVHLLEEFSGQSFPEQSAVSVMEANIDIPLAEALLGRWIIRFAKSAERWKDRALFRSLNMANEAGKIPALTAGSFYDAGRSIALWISAYEILAHPGGTAQSNVMTVTALLEKIAWHDPNLAHAIHESPGKPGQMLSLTPWLCRKLYGLRNAFLHGNEVDDSALLLNGKPVIDFAAVLYRVLLTAFLNLPDNTLLPAECDAASRTSYLDRNWRTRRIHAMFEAALLTAVQRGL